MDRKGQITQNFCRLLQVISAQPLVWLDISSSSIEIVAPGRDEFMTAAVTMVYGADVLSHLTDAPSQPLCHVKDASRRASGIPNWTEKPSFKTRRIANILEFESRPCSTHVEQSTAIPINSDRLKPLQSRRSYAGKSVLITAEQERAADAVGRARPVAPQRDGTRTDTAEEYPLYIIDVWALREVVDAPEERYQKVLVCMEKKAEKEEEEEL